MVYTLRWGILSTGRIATEFSLDLLIDPSTRQVCHVAHRIVAVGSRSKNSAQKFVDNVWSEAGVKEGKEQVTLYGSYDELLADKDVDCIYIGTPHSHHYANAHAALSAGKNVLCEKSLVVNAAQAKALIDLARSKDLFLMEAVWLRFQPCMVKMRELLPTIGDVRGASAELCCNFAPQERTEPDARLFNPKLAGGALLDLGPYPWTHLALALLPPSSSSTEPLPVPKITSSMVKTTTGVDRAVVAGITFIQPDGREVLGSFVTAQDRQSPITRCSLIQGSHGFIEIGGPPIRPWIITVTRWKNEENLSLSRTLPDETETYDFREQPGGMRGCAWEADDVARCIRDGKKESERMPLRESLLMMQVFDEIRRQHDFAFPAEIESVELL
ncbi:hypothetical protein NBRC10512_003872 [Rhodotorula toruloides]|uniref:D-xylose 1-dehydrogenase (NADP(+), D-xylono-1,5-lactone-forming) n=2 Tax=Rhodotorula toruloides TaxID=5286 RepID=A0A061ADQ0_RHOTO|nr:dihydrodiol dehydrogenase / D-xylose 1-dehydrogenase (NADP) [Rhodotorula toruloides NP11]EMS21818.1 dihydrodiol dehydrogenase / D-xylose 1-dehydrogenase (NADP) [Rhodotorula toruloides NP11]CDR35692.1 RHTO0S01e05006g1_1 [Rhodotorula toruloides]